MKILRLRCSCRRNLADVTHRDRRDPDPGLHVVERPNVQMSKYQPNDMEALAAGYTWRCQCGQTWAVTHARIIAMWNEERHDTRRVVHRFL